MVVGRSGDDGWSHGCWCCLSQRRRLIIAPDLGCLDGVLFWASFSIVMEGSVDGSGSGAGPLVRPCGGVLGVDMMYRCGGTVERCCGLQVVDVVAGCLHLVVAGDFGLLEAWVAWRRRCDDAGGGIGVGLLSHLSWRWSSWCSLVSLVFSFGRLSRVVVEFSPTTVIGISCIAR